MARQDYKRGLRQTEEASPGKQWNLWPTHYVARRSGRVRVYTHEEVRRLNLEREFDQVLTSPIKEKA